jgi:hypothetical protein
MGSASRQDSPARAASPKVRLPREPVASEPSTLEQELPAKSAPRPKLRRDTLLYLGLVLLTWAVWAVSRLNLFTAASNTGYWIGVSGGACMLLLFTYPMRKHLKFMTRFGSAKPWFLVHMVLGIAGPYLILLHSTFRIGSLNAGVALYSMLVVASSGVVGRFLYVRLHRDVHGQKLTLAELRGEYKDAATHATRLSFAPGVVERLVAFEKRALGDRGTASSMLAGLMLPLDRWQVEYACSKELKIKLLTVARAERWSRNRTRRLLAQARRLVQDDLMTVQRIVQFSAWQKLFSWWHVAHVPFVYLMVLSAVAHVVAVHIY